MYLWCILRLEAFKALQTKARAQDRLLHCEAHSTRKMLNKPLVFLCMHAFSFSLMLLESLFIILFVSVKVAAEACLW